MQERLRLAGASSDAGPSEPQQHSARLDHSTSGDGSGVHVSANGGAGTGSTGAAGLGVLSSDCQPVEVSMYLDVPQPGVGLTNLGNTCYLNSVLQCLLHTRPLHNLLLERYHSEHCEYGHGRADGFCPLCLLERRLRGSFFTEPKHPRPLAIAKNLHRILNTHGLVLVLRIGEQEDAHELLRLMIDSCHRTCLLQQRGLPMTALKRFEDRTGKVPTVISDIFGGVLQSQVKCLTCNFESNKRDVFMDLSLDLAPSTHSVYAALQAFITPERLDGANKYRCERCKKLSAARKQMQILRAPNVLVIQLKRFENICGGKITRHVHFSETLSLAGFMAPGSRDPPPEYTLYALIVHEGSTQQLGHYYACAKASRVWYCFNDSSVRPVHWSDVSRQGAYILFYLRTRPPGSVFFYPPKSQVLTKESAGGAARVNKQQPPEGNRGAVESPVSAKTGRTEAGGTSTGPLIGPQLPPGYRGPVKQPGSAEVGRANLGNGAAAAAVGPLYGPQLPPGYRGPVEPPANSEGGRAGLGNGAAAEAAGPLYGPQLPPGSRGPVESGTGAGTVQTEVGSSAAALSAGPSYEPQLPLNFLGPVGSISEPELAGSKSRDERGALSAGPSCELPTPLGPVGVSGGTGQSNSESSSQMKGPPARPVPPLPIPPETPPLPQGLVSQAVTAEGNQGGRCERGGTGPPLSPGGAVEGAGRKMLNPSLDGKPLADPCDNSGGADHAVSVTTNGSVDQAGRAESNGGDVSVPLGDDVCMSGSKMGAAGEREPHSLKRRLSGSDAPVAPESKRKVSKSERMFDVEVDGRLKSGEDNRGGLICEAAGGGDTQDTVEHRASVAGAGDGVAAGDLVMPSVIGLGNGIGQEGSKLGSGGVGKDVQTGNSTGQGREAARLGSRKIDGGEGVVRAAASGPPQPDTLLNGGEGMSTRPQGALVEVHGAPGGHMDAGGKVEIVDASAWSLAFSYGSDDDEEREETLKKAGVIGLSSSACPVEGRIFDQGLKTDHKPLPGLVEAESLLQGGPGLGIFGWSKT
ncbi:Ubiquitin carboxyl-terminal hydrolase [Klebsormidium nitens]|uniref:ubiquitinyl hydrolase 1 n=1 Tax=Klebsormidium nitens TaxID=105231 RepID=A0A0U9HI24_KLENI|nr:Ubiquitin carboxyl-terminal hydrolase [Klebsormidium nitens]|eukprot:GAQ79449.1 Ubiquitin carboxyl-terminal hydrolase [Klebsormidium nitens]